MHDARHAVGFVNMRPGKVNAGLAFELSTFGHTTAFLSIYRFLSFSSAS